MIKKLFKKIYLFIIWIITLILILILLHVSESCKRTAVVPTFPEKARLIPIMTYEPKLIPFSREKPPVNLADLPVISGEVKASLHFKDESGKEVVIIETKRGEYYQVSPEEPKEIKIYQWKRKPLEFPLFNQKLIFSENYDFGNTIYFCIGFDLIRFRSLRFGADVGISLLREILVSPCLRYEFGELILSSKKIFYVNLNAGYNLISRRPVIGFSLTW